MKGKTPFALAGYRSDMSISWSNFSLQLFSLKIVKTAKGKAAFAFCHRKSQFWLSRRREGSNRTTHTYKRNTCHLNQIEIKPSNRHRKKKWRPLYFELPRSPGGSVHGDRANFTRLVLGCMESYDSVQILILQHFSRSTRFAFLCTAPKSGIQQEVVMFFLWFSLRIS